MQKGGDFWKGPATHSNWMHLESCQWQQNKLHLQANLENTIMKDDVKEVFQPLDNNSNNANTINKFLARSSENGSFTQDSASSNDLIILKAGNRGKYYFSTKYEIVAICTAESIRTETEIT